MSTSFVGLVGRALGYFLYWLSLTRRSSPFCRFRLLFSYLTIIEFAFSSFSLNLKLTASANHSACPLSVPLLLWRAEEIRGTFTVCMRWRVYTCNLFSVLAAKMICFCSRVLNISCTYILRLFSMVAEFRSESKRVYPVVKNLGTVH